MIQHDMTRRRREQAVAERRGVHENTLAEVRRYQGRLFNKQVLHAEMSTRRPKLVIARAETTLRTTHADLRRLF